MSEIARWLDGRTPTMPGELRRVLDTALDRAALDRAALERGVPPDAGSIADRLAEAGLAALERAIDDDIAAEPDRQRATDLLAADAFLTYACEAAAEEGPEALDRLTGSLNFGRFEAILDRDTP